MTSVLSHSRKITWMIWIIASIFYAYQYILRVMPNILLDDIMQRFSIDAATFGQFSGVYYLGYSLMHLPIGIMLDRYGPRKVMSLCMLITVAGLTPLIFADHWVFPIIGRFLIGIGSSAAILGVFKIIRMAFKEERFSRMLSFSVTIGLIGAIYGGGPVNYMLSKFGYETVIYLFATIGTTLAFITYWLVPNVKTIARGSVMSDVKEVLSNSKVIASCIFAGLMVGPLEGFADVWGTAYLSQVFSFDHSMAATLPSLIFIGMCFGSPVLNFIAEKARNYLLTIIGAGIAMTIGFVLLLSCSWTTSLISLNFVIIGVCSSYQILAIYKASTYVPEQKAGLTTALANMIIMVFGYVFHSVIGAVVNALGGPHSPEALAYGVGVIPVALCLGACGFIWLWIRERKEQKFTLFQNLE